MRILGSFFILCIACFSHTYAQAPLLSDSDNKVNELPFTTKELFVKTDDAQIFCRVIGNGNPIVVIHGGPGLTQDYLLPQMAKLAKNNRVIFYDQRGCGQSSGEINADSIRIETFMNDLESIRKAFGYSKITILGHSWGGFLAMEYAIEHPESVQNLILLNSCPASSEEYNLFLQEYMKRLAPFQDELNSITESDKFVEGDPATIEKYFRIIFRTYCYDPIKANYLDLRMSPKAFIDGTKVSKIFNQNILTKPFSLHEQLKKIQIPTLIIHGDFDVAPYAGAQKIHESIDNSKYILIKNCGHFPFVESPDEFFEALGRFLDKNQ